MTTLTTQRDRQEGLVLSRSRAGDLMTSDMATIVATTTVGEAMTLMRTLNIRHLPVLGDGKFVGIVDEKLLASALLSADGFDAALLQPVTCAMTHYVPHVGPGEALPRVAQLLRTGRCDAVVVIDGQDRLLGIITTVDVVSALAASSVSPPPFDADGGPASVDVSDLGRRAASSRTP